jgi:four helix bundle protein
LSEGTVAKSYRDLKVWNRAIDLTTLVYAITSEFPQAEIYGLTSQMRRAAVSIASNLAEGSARGTRKDFRQFVLIARGSNCELQTQFTISRRLNFGKQQKIDEAEAISHEIGQMLSGLAKYLGSKEKARSTEN